jgi:hypothetical protein
VDHAPLGVTPQKLINCEPDSLNAKLTRITFTPLAKRLRVMENNIVAHSPGVECKFRLELMVIMEGVNKEQVSVFDLDIKGIACNVAIIKT